MSRKTKPAKPTASADPETIYADLDRQQFVLAADAARKRYRRDSNPANLKLLKEVLFTIGMEHADHDRTQSAINILSDLRALPDPDGTSITIQAKVLARAGRADEAAKLIEKMPNPPEGIANIIPGHSADRAIRLGSTEGLPSQLHAGFEAVQAAVKCLEANDSEGLKQQLQAIGLNSPYLPWKLLLRGLQAYNQQDNARAVENFRRIEAERLPGKMAACLLSRIDDEFAANTRPTLVQAFKSRAASGKSAPQTVRALRKLVGHMSGRQTLRPRNYSETIKLYKAAKNACLQECPDRLKEVELAIYREVQKVGQVEDLECYVDTFAPPAFDPEYLFINAYAFESCGQINKAEQVAIEYIEDVKKFPPAILPPDVKKTVLACLTYWLAGIQFDIYEASQGFNPLHKPAVRGAFLLAGRQALRKALHNFQEALKIEPELITKGLTLGIVESCIAELSVEDLYELMEFLASNKLPYQDCYYLGIEKLLKEPDRHRLLAIVRQLIADNPLQKLLESTYPIVLQAYARELLVNRKYLILYSLLERSEEFSRLEPLDHASLKATAEFGLKMLRNVDDAPAELLDNDFAMAKFLVDLCVAKIQASMRKPLESRWAALLDKPDPVSWLRLKHYLAILELQGHKNSIIDKMSKAVLNQLPKVLASMKTAEEFEEFFLNQPFGLNSPAFWRILKTHLPKKAMDNLIVRLCCIRFALCDEYHNFREAPSFVMRMATSIVRLLPHDWKQKMHQEPYSSILKNIDQYTRLLGNEYVYDHICQNDDRGY